MALVDVAPLGVGANHVGFVGLARRIEVSGKRPDGDIQSRNRANVSRGAQSTALPRASKAKRA